MSTRDLLLAAKDTEHEIQRTLNDIEQAPGRAWLAEQDAQASSPADEPLSEAEIERVNHYVTGVVLSAALDVGQLLRLTERALERLAEAMTHSLIASWSEAPERAEVSR